MMPLLTRAGLRAEGVTDRQIAAAVASGTWTRLRGGIYAAPPVEPDLVVAVAAGGRLACTSELRRRGAWVLDQRLHIHVVDRANPPPQTVTHWRSLVATPGIGSVSAIDAVIDALTCLDRRAAVAAVDSALHRRLVRRTQLDSLSLTKRARAILTLADARAESGLESLARLIVHDLGMRATPQVVFPGIGRVDLVVEGVVVVEADGDEFHSDTAARRRDRRRDAQLAALDRPVLRFGYDQLVGRPDEVARALIRTVAGHRAVKNPGSLAARAAHRARQLGWT